MTSKVPQKSDPVLLSSMSFLVVTVALLGFLSAGVPPAASLDLPSSVGRHHKVRSRNGVQQSRYVAGPDHYLRGVSSDNDATDSGREDLTSTAARVTSGLGHAVDGRRHQRAAVAAGASVSVANERCETAIRDMQSSLLRLYGSQVECGRGLHNVHNMVETLRRDVDYLR